MRLPCVSFLQGRASWLRMSLWVSRRLSAGHLGHTVHNEVHGEDSHDCVVHVPAAGSMGKRLAQVGVDNTEENRRQFRQILFSADDRINSCLGGVIFFHETLYQHSDSGVSFVKIIRDRGILIGVKVPYQMLGTSRCLLFNTSWTVGIDSDTFDTSAG